MSEAAAAFFANKKRKKKAFKFNANLVDVSAVTQTTHVDAPALSKDVEAPPQTSTVAQTGPAAPVVTDNEQEPNDAVAASKDDGQQWDEAAVVARKNTPATSAAAGPEVLDMKSLAQSKNSNNIAEKLRVEETKAKLAAAREGMERQAAQVKAEKDRKEQDAKAKDAARASATANTGAAGGIWVSARMRAQATMPKMRMGLAASSQQNLDMTNEELFPDLGAADKIMEQKEKSARKGPGPKKTPVGGGANWATKATKPKIPKKPPAKPPMKRVVVEETKPVEEKPKEDVPAPAPVQEKPAPEPIQESAPELVVTAPVVPDLKPKKGKKKKKDLSTFKAGG